MIVPIMMICMISLYTALLQIALQQVTEFVQAPISEYLRSNQC